MKIPYLSTLFAIAVSLGSPPTVETVFIDFAFTPGPDGLLGTADDVPIENSLGFGGELDGDEFESVGVLFSTPELQLNMGCGNGPGDSDNCLGADDSADDRAHATSTPGARGRRGCSGQLIA